MVLIYPVITMGEKTHGGSKNNLLGKNPDARLVDLFSNEKQVTPQTPPAFLAHAKDDRMVVPDNSKAFHEALQKEKVKVKYLELPAGGHGLNGYKGEMWDAWQTQSLAWLAELKFIPAPGEKKTPLDDYLAKPDPTYAWKLVKTIPGDGVTCFVLDLKSQSWRSIPEVDRPVWQHWLTITKPDKVTGDTALLSIGGGRNGGEAPTAAPGDAIDRARRSGTVVVSLGQVPNQPLVFNKDGKERS